MVRNGQVVKKPRQQQKHLNQAQAARTQAALRLWLYKVFPQGYLQMLIGLNFAHTHGIPPHIHTFKVGKLNLWKKCNAQCCEMPSWASQLWNSMGKKPLPLFTGSGNDFCSNRLWRNNLPFHMTKGIFNSRDYFENVTLNAKLPKWKEKLYCKLTGWMTGCYWLSKFVMECHGMSWNVMECHGMSWNVMECHGM